MKEKKLEENLININLKKYLYYLSIFTIFANILLMIFLPYVVRYFNTLLSFDYKKILIFLYITEIPFTIVLICIFMLCKKLFLSKQFDKGIIKYLDYIIIACFVEAVLYSIALILSKYLIILFIIASIFVVFLFTSIIKQIILDGIVYYEDSKGTI